jgi:hypothetical protein
VDGGLEIPVLLLDEGDALLGPLVEDVAVGLLGLLLASVVVDESVVVAVLVLEGEQPMLALLQFRL